MSSSPEPVVNHRVPVVNKASRMEPRCTTRLRQKLRYWDGVLTQLPESWLKIAHVFFYFAFPIYGIITLLCGKQQHDLILEVCGLSGILVFPVFVLCLPGCFKFVYTLWFDLASLLLLTGAALMNTHGGVSNFLFAVGGTLMGLLVIGTLLRCICGTRRVEEV